MKNIFFLLCVFLAACTTKKNSFHSVLNTDNLAVQNFAFAVDTDSTLITASGCIIKIKKNTFSAKGDSIHLIVKEAITNEQIVLAGLTTMSGGQPLSSGGMIFINADPADNAKIENVLEVMVPTNDYNPDMQLFEGKEIDGGIDWINPDSLPDAGIQQRVRNGKALYIANCANCHKMGKDYTGPALAGVTEKRTKAWLYQFINNPAATNDAEATKLKRKWAPTIMTSFPQLKPNEIDNILAYMVVNGSSTKAKRDAFLESLNTDDNFCRDSCLAYWNAVNRLNDAQFELDNISTKQEFFTLEETIPIIEIDEPNEARENSKPENPSPIEKVEPKTITGTFYTINIKAFGWHNIDVLLEAMDSSPATLLMDVQSNENVECNVALIIPSHKIFTEGGKLEDLKFYGFKNMDGSLLLPQGEKGIVIAFGEKDGILYFGSSEFYAKFENKLIVTLQKTTKEQLAAEIDKLKLSDTKLEVTESTLGLKTLEINEASKDIELLKPKNCDCGFPINTSDSSFMPLSMK